MALILVIIARISQSLQAMMMLHIRKFYKDFISFRFGFFHSYIYLVFSFFGIFLVFLFVYFFVVVGYITFIAERSLWRRIQQCVCVCVGLGLWPHVRAPLDDALLIT